MHGYVSHGYVKISIIFPSESSTKINELMLQCSRLPCHHLYILMSLFSNVYLKSYTEPSITNTCSYSANQQLEIYIVVRSVIVCTSMVCM